MKKVFLGFCLIIIGTVFLASQVGFVLATDKACCPRVGAGGVVDSQLASDDCDGAGEQYNCQCAPKNCTTDNDGDIDTDEEKIEAGRAGVCTPKDSARLCPFGPPDIESLIKSIIGWVFYLAVIIFPLIIVIAAFVIMTSTGEPAKVVKARSMIIWASIGLGVILFSRIFYSIITKILTG